MATAPKRHHYIPQMMLRHFADADERLWFWRRDFARGDVRKTTPQNLFVEKDLYAYVGEDGAKDLSLETFFALLEGEGAQFIERLSQIVRDGGVPELDEGAWEFWDNFFYYLQKRTPGAIAAIAEKMGFDARIQATAERFRAIRAERGEVEMQENLEDWIRKNAIVFAQAQRPSPELRAVLTTLGLAIYRITDPKRSFIVGDVPGAMARFRTGNNWSHPTMFVPLTADIAVGHLTGARRAEVIEVDADQARRMNIATAARSSVIAGRSSALVASLSRIPYAGVAPIEVPAR